MKFWDASAVVSLPTTRTSTIARAEHEQMLDQHEAAAAFTRLDDLARVWTEVEPASDLVRL